MRNRGRISHGRAALSAIAIFVYFAVFTAWLPSYVLRTALSSAPKNVADLVTVGIWGATLLAGLWGLRKAQEEGWI